MTSEQFAAIGSPAPRRACASSGARDPCRNMSAPYFRAATNSAVLCLRRFSDQLCRLTQDDALLASDCVRRVGSGFCSTCCHIPLLPYIGDFLFAPSKSGTPTA
jgi:hypothetical protein